MANKLAQLGMLAMAGAELIGCGIAPKTETTPRVIIADKRNGVVKQVKRTLSQCGPKSELKEIAKNRCESNIKFKKEGNLNCLSCDYTAEVVE